jgi:predicted unusual protein kinase regulating ubiquinone biosynthesis (AarF/ABC1/UbiB family)
MPTVTRVVVDMCSDLPALLDEWASSLFRELDYRREAANGTRFKVTRRLWTALLKPFKCISMRHSYALACLSG